MRLKAIRTDKTFKTSDRIRNTMTKRIMLSQRTDRMDHALHMKTLTERKNRHHTKIIHTERMTHTERNT